MIDSGRIAINAGRAGGQQDSDAGGGGVVQRQCVRCMQWLCWGFVLGDVDSVETFLNTRW
jgi:hypothetical protein